MRCERCAREDACHSGRGRPRSWIECQMWSTSSWSRCQEYAAPIHIARRDSMNWLREQAKTVTNARAGRRTRIFTGEAGGGAKRPRDYGPRDYGLRACAGGKPAAHPLHRYITYATGQTLKG